MSHRCRPSAHLVSLARALAFVALASAFAGCSLLTSNRVAPPPSVVVPTQPDPNAPRLAALQTRQFTLGAGQELVGETQVLFARYENTFSAIGREYDLGYEEMRSANPGVDQWLPGEGTPIYLPTQSILPAAAHKGIVINVPAMRLYYFTTEKTPVTAEKSAGAAEQSAADPPAVTTTVTTYPIGIGAEGWATPFGEAKVTQKARDPVWYVPASVRKEHLERGDKLPSVVPPGPDNPLGAFAMTLSIPSYLIHGTNKPDGVGMRSSHGCIRLYPEDIEALFGRVPKGTPVRIVNQPLLAAWRDGQLYLEVHPPLAEEKHDLVAEAEGALKRALEHAGPAAAGVEIDSALVQRIVTEQRGIPLPVLRSNRSLEQYLAASRIVVNTVPVAVAEEGRQVAGGVASAGR